MPNEDGQTERESLEHVLEASPPDSPSYLSAYYKIYSGPQVPACLEHVWHWFHDLHSTRRAGFSGPDPLSFSEIQAWMNLTGTIVRPYEVQIIKALDNAFLKHMQKQQQKKKKKSN